MCTFRYIPAAVPAPVPPLAAAAVAADAVLLPELTAKVNSNRLVSVWVKRAATGEGRTVTAAG